MKAGLPPERQWGELGLASAGMRSKLALGAWRVL